MNRIPYILRDKGWTHEQLATKAGISRETVLQLVNAVGIPPDTPWGIIKTVARALGVTTDALEEITETPDRKPRTLEELAGIWADDDEIAAIFEEIAREREADILRYDEDLTW